MQELTIVYTDNIGEFAPALVGELPDLKRSYAAFSRLSKITEIPREIGLITVTPFQKKNSQELLSGVEKPKTSYVPLALIEAMMRTNVEAELFSLHAGYRELSRYKIKWDSLNPQDVARLPMAITTLHTMQAYRKLISEHLHEHPEEENEFANILNLLDWVPKPSNLDDLATLYTKQLALNKVSVGFPLYYIPSETATPILIAHDIVHTSLAGDGKSSLYLRVTGDVEQCFEPNDFVCVRQPNFKSLMQILSDYPNPTIITDIYPVDLFPELLEINFRVEEVTTKRLNTQKVD